MVRLLLTRCRMKNVQNRSAAWTTIKLRTSKWYVNVCSFSERNLATYDSFSFGHQGDDDDDFAPFYQWFYDNCVLTLCPLQKWPMLQMSFTWTAHSILLRGRTSAHEFGWSRWSLHLSAEHVGDLPAKRRRPTPYRFDFCCLGVICWSFRIIPPNCGLWQEPLWKLLWPRMSQQLIWMTRPRMHVLRNLVPPGDCTPARKVTSWNSWVVSKFHSYLTSGCEHTCYISLPFSCSCKSPRWRRDTEITKKVVRK